jgi:hypothetical protein
VIIVSIFDNLGSEKVGQEQISGTARQKSMTLKL